VGGKEKSIHQGGIAIYSKAVLVLIIVINKLVFVGFFEQTTEKESRTRQRFLSQCSLDKDRRAPASMFQIVDF